MHTMPVYAIYSLARVRLVLVPCNYHKHYPCTCMSNHVDPLRIELCFVLPVDVIVKVDRRRWKLPKPLVLLLCGSIWPYRIKDESYSESELDWLLIGSGWPAVDGQQNVLEVLCSICYISAQIDRESDSNSSTDHDSSTHSTNSDNDS